MHPAPFEVVRQEGMPDVASNGTIGLVVLDGGKMWRRRGISTSAIAPPGERILPLLNALAGELLANPEMAPEEVAARLHALQLLCKPAEVQRMEWAVGELDGVRVYTDGEKIVLTRQDLTIG